MVRIKATRQRGNKARKGTAAVEFALVSLPLLALTIGIIDYGWIFLKAQQITQAARAGARAAIMPDATNASVADAIEEVLTDVGISDYSVTKTPPDVSTVTAGNFIRVVVTVPTNQLALIRATIVPVPPELVASASMAKEGK